MSDAPNPHQPTKPTSGPKPDDTGPRPGDTARPAGAPGADPDLRPGARPVPDYELIEKLGEGSFGQVWKARDDTGRAVALKFLRPGPDAAGEAVRELELMKEVGHAHLLVLHRYWRLGGWLVVALELAQGTLLDRLREAHQRGQAGVPLRELLEYFREAAKGLDYLHSLGIQHRDVKPANLLLVGGTVKVADFGLAKLLESTVATNTNRLMAGTPAFAAPETWEGKTSTRSDQYALAITWCQLRTGKLPFEGSLMALAYAHCHKDPDLSMLPAAERPAVARALSKDPGGRWPSCRDFVAALIRCYARRPPENATPAPPTPSPQPGPDPSAPTVPGRSATRPPHARSPARPNPGARTPRPGRRVWSYALAAAACVFAVGVTTVLLVAYRAGPRGSGDQVAVSGTLQTGKSEPPKASPRPPAPEKAGDKAAPAPPAISSLLRRHASDAVTDTSIGVRLFRDPASGRTAVLTPIKGSPAYRRGIQSGDVITHITREVDSQGEPLSQPEVLQAQGLSLHDVVEKIQGAAGTKVRLTVQREGSDRPLDFELTRGRVLVNSVLGWKRNPDDEWSYLIDPVKRIGYVRLTSFSNSTAHDLQPVMTELTREGIRGFILDLRFNPGGLLESAVKISDLYIDDGLIVSIRPRAGRETRYGGRHEGSLLDFVMVCLVNGRSAAESEIVAAALQDHKRALVVGERTRGVATAQMPDLGGEVTFWRPSGRNLNKASTAGKSEDEWGVTPDKVVALTVKQRKDLNDALCDAEIIRRKDVPPEEPEPGFEDRQLDAALSYIRGQIHIAESAGAKSSR